MNKSCGRHSNCHYAEGATECSWPPCVRIGCHLVKKWEAMEQRFDVALMYLKMACGDKYCDHVKSFIKAEIVLAEKTAYDKGFDDAY